MLQKLREEKQNQNKMLCFEKEQLNTKKEHLKIKIVQPNNFFSMTGSSRMQNEKDTDNMRDGGGKKIRVSIQNIQHPIGIVKRENLKDSEEEIFKEIKQNFLRQDDINFQFEKATKFSDNE